MQRKETRVAEHPVHDSEGQRATVVESAEHVLLHVNGTQQWTPNNLRAYRIGTATLEPTSDGTGFVEHATGKRWHRD